MPIVRIEMWEGRGPEVKKRLIENVSGSVSKTLEIPMEAVQVVIADIPKTNWGIAGIPASERKT